MQRRTSRGLAVGDLFNDGQLDVVVEDIDGPPMVLRNHGVPGQHWIGLELAGTKSNRMAIWGADQVDRRRHDANRSDPERRELSLTKRSPSALWPVLPPRSTASKFNGHPEQKRQLRTSMPISLDPVLEGKGVVPAAQLAPR